MKKFVIDKKSFPTSFGSYIVIIIVFIFLCEIFVKNFILGIPFGIITCILDYLYTSHYWEFNENGIKVGFYFRKKTLEFDSKTIKLVSQINNRFEGPGFKIIIKYKSNILNKIFLPSYKYYEPQSKGDFFRIKNFAIENKIEIEGDWNWE